MRHWIPLVLFVGAALCAAVPAGAIQPGRPAVLDAFADSLGTGGFGTVFELDRLQDPAGNASAFGADGSLLVPTSIAFHTSGDVLVSDAESDPSGLGVVVGGGDGPGAVYRIDGNTGASGILSDGSQYLPGLPGGTQTIFVEVSGLAVRGDGFILVTDMDADPSGFGLDPEGFPGHGAVFVVDPANGNVDLFSDGSITVDTLPAGEESMFVDPVELAFDTARGALYLLDQLADPLGLGRIGALYEIDSGGSVRLLASPPEFDAPRDLAVLSDGTVLVAGEDATTGEGTIWDFDPDNADPAASASVFLSGGDLVGPSGLTVAPNGWLFVADEFADPLGLARRGAVFRYDPVHRTTRVVSSDAKFQSVADIAIPTPVAAPPTVLSIDPVNLLQGEQIPVTILGTGFDSLAEPDLGPGLPLSQIQVVDPTTVMAVVDVPLQAPPGPRDVRVHNPDLQAGLLVEGAVVEERARPLIAQVAPGAAPRGSRLSVQIQGSNFADGATVSFGAGISIVAVTFLADTELEVAIDIDPAAALGFRDVTVTNPDTLEDTLAASFEVVLPPPPRIDLANPALLDPGARVEVVLEGDGFRTGQLVDLGPGVRVLAAEPVQPEEFHLTVFVEGNAVPGTRAVRVEDSETGIGALPDGVEIRGATVLSISALQVLDDGPGTGNGSGSVEPGEVVALVPRIRNEGNVTASGVGVVLSLDPPVPGVQVVQNFVGIPDIAPGTAESRDQEPHLLLQLDEDVPCDTVLPLLLELRVMDQPAQFLGVALPLGQLEGWDSELELAGGAGDSLGASLVGIGDADGDGFPDWAVSAPFYNNAGLVAAGRVLVYSGGGGNLLGDWRGDAADLEFGSALAGPGDLNGDGLADLVIGSPGAAADAGRVEARSVVDGSVLWSLPGVSPERWGTVLASAGDTDGEGTGDVLLGVPLAQSETGQVFLLDGVDGSVLGTMQGDAPGERLGQSLVRAGDLDGDALEDWIAGAPTALGGDGLLVAAGLGSSGIQERWRVPGGAGARLGSDLFRVGDMDGDGWADTAAQATGTGGQPEQLVIVSRSGVPVRFYQGQSGEAFAAAAAPTGDIDGDGLDDLWIGAPEALGARGEVRLFSGNGALLTAMQGGEDGSFGAELASPGDLDGDVRGELLVGSPGANVLGATGSGAASRFGSRSVCEPFETCTQDGYEPNDRIAEAVAIPMQTAIPDLVSCPHDDDWFSVDQIVGAGILVRTEWDPTSGELELAIVGSDGIPLDASFGGDGLAEVVVRTIGESPLFVRVRSRGDARIPYRLEVLDPASCVPRQEVGGLRLAKVEGGLFMTWSGVGDACHAEYAIFRAESVRPSGAGAFPDDPGFLTVSDGDGDTSNPSALVDSSRPFEAYLVLSQNDRGELGPSGHYE